MNSTDPRPNSTGSTPLPGAQCSAAGCGHIIAFADERDAHPCPVCELARWKSEHKHLSDALVDLQAKLVDLRIPVIGIGDDVRKLVERFESYEKELFAIQQRHGHLKPPTSLSNAGPATREQLETL